MQDLFSGEDCGTEALWPLDVREDNSSVAASVVKAIAVGVAFGLLSAAGLVLPRGNHDIFTFCAANGALAAFLLCRSQSRWWMFLLAAWLGGEISVHVVLGYAPALSGTVAFCNVLESLLAAWLLQRAVERTQCRDLASPAMLPRFLLGAVLAAPAVSSLLASVVYRTAGGESMGSFLVTWFAPHAVGMAVTMPLVLTMWSPKLRELFAGRRILRTVGILLLNLAVSILIFQQTHYSLRFLWIPLLMLVIFEVGVMGAVIATFEILAVGIVYTVHGHGLLWMTPGSTLHGNIILLQAAVLVLLVSSVCFAAIVERQRQLQTSLQREMKRYRLLADNSRDIVVLANLDGRRLYVSPAVQDALGWTQEEWTHQDAADYMHSEDLGAFQRMLKEMLHGEDRRTFRYRTRHKNGKYLWMEASVRKLHDETSGKPNAFVANVRDISERVDSDRKLAEAYEHLRQQAQRDSLTQLANRRHFDETLEKEWRRGRRTGNSLALVMVDIDHFKRVNDTYGHRAGDQCLLILASLLQRIATRRPGDLAARYGGEEFALLLPDVDMEAALVLADGLCLRVREQLFQAGVGVSLGLTVSVGVAAMVPNKNTRADLLVEAADRALYAAKQAGRNRIMPGYKRELPAALLHQVQ